MPASTNEVVAILASRVLFAAVGLLVLGWAMALGASRRELYLRVGDLNATTRSRRKDGSNVRWSRFGPLALHFAIDFVIFTFIALASVG